MISVRKNPNFKEWFQVFAFGKMVDEVRRESEALQLAKRAGRRVNQDYIYFVDNNLLLDEINNTSNMEYLVTVYNLKWLSSFLEKLNIANKIKFPPQGHVQRTLVIKRGDQDVGALKQLYEANKNLVDILL